MGPMGNHWARGTHGAMGTYGDQWDPWEDPWDQWGEWEEWVPWEEWEADPWLVQVLQEEDRIPFSKHPPLSARPFQPSSYHPSSERYPALGHEISQMLEKQAIEVVPSVSPGYYSRIFMVSKASGGWRPVLDLSQLNDFMQVTHFKMETVASVRSSIKKKDFMATIDLKDAYFQIPVHLESRKYLRFVWEETMYQFKVLCFRLARAPQVFTLNLAPVAVWAHRRGV